jgi:hypothetical protein
MQQLTFQDAAVFPLSLGQMRLWFQEQLHPGMPTYNVPVALRLAGPLNVSALEESFQRILERHEILRTSIATLHGQPVQMIAPEAALSLPVMDLSGLPGPEREASVLRIAVEQFRRPFELVRAPLMRASLLRLGREEHVLCMTMHHLIMDGWSVGVLFEELAAFYAAACSGARAGLPELPIQYADFAMWQRSSMDGARLDRELAYWKAQLLGAPPVLELPNDQPRPAAQTYNGASRTFLLPAALQKELREMAARERVTMFMLLLAGFQVVLHFLSGGEEDLVVGTDYAGRSCVETERLIGFFVNQLVLRTDLSGNPSFRELLRRVREVTLGAFAHHDMPFEKLVEALRPVRNPKYLPLFQAKFVFQNAPEMAWNFPGLRVSPVQADPGFAKFDLLLEFRESSAGLEGLFQYNTDLFSASTANRILQHVETILREAVAAPGAALTALERKLAEHETATRMEHTARLRQASLLKLASVKRMPAALAV